jgi:hypothetical protein
MTMTAAERDRLRQLARGHPPTRPPALELFCERCGNPFTTAMKRSLCTPCTWGGAKA